MFIHVFLLLLGIYSRESCGQRNNLNVYMYWIKGSGSGDQLPQRIDLYLYFQNILYLSLVRENNNIQDVPVVGKLKSLSRSIRSSALYRDPTKHATFSVGIMDREVLYYGEFTLEDYVYTLMPYVGFRSENQGSSGKSTVYELNLNSTRHYLTKEKPSISSPGDDDVKSKANNGKSLVNPVDSKARNLFPAKVDGKILYTIEILVVLDYSVYSKWYANSKGSVSTTIANLKQYYAHVVNGIKENYEGMDIPGTKFSASLAGFYIADTKKKSYFTENLKQNSYGIDANSAVESVRDWVSKMINSFPVFDVAAVFTSLALLPSFNGMAYIGAACTFRGVSINRDTSPFDTILTATHEIGHNMGSYHDSENNNCKHEHQYIMAKGRISTKGNYSTFSPCSINYFLDYLNFMNSRNQMCLTNLPESIFPSDVGDFLNQHPGQKMSLDEQCQIIYGSHAQYCGGNDGSTICMQMNCKSGQACHESPSAEGTSCGDGMWCRKGVCTKDSRAPPMKKECSFGDMRLPISHNGRMYQCQEFVKHHSWICYEDYYRSKCCETCEAKKKSLNNPDCPYGDRRADCDVKICFTADYAKSCCHTCKGATFDSSGRLVLTCSNEVFEARCGTVSSTQCYGDQGKICCKSCNKFRVTGIPNCEYGDKASWCEGRVKKTPNECNTSPHIKSTCCKSCHHATG